MKIYRYWIRCEEILHLPEGDQKSVFYGTSNISMEDARENAREKSAALQRRICSGIRKDPDYEVPIREELLAEVSPGNLITRNRYGAEVLNSETVLFADVDEDDLPKRYRPNVIMRMFGKKEESPDDFERRLRSFVADSIRPEWKEQGHIRVYRTRAGFRILLAGMNIDAGSKECTRLLRSLHSDWLYTELCKKQRCCRARLTPKPSRIRMKGHRFQYPCPEEELPVCQKWLTDYQEKSSQFAVCKLLETYGTVPSEADSIVISYHDRSCKTETNLPLA